VQDLQSNNVIGRRAQHATVILSTLSFDAGSVNGGPGPSGGGMGPQMLRISRTYLKERRAMSEFCLGNDQQAHPKHKTQSTLQCPHADPECLRRLPRTAG
jgi:hypothetical protein